MCCSKGLWFVRLKRFRHRTRFGCLSHLLVSTNLDMFRLCKCIDFILKSVMIIFLLLLYGINAEHLYSRPFPFFFTTHSRPVTLASPDLLTFCFINGIMNSSSQNGMFNHRKLSFASLSTAWILRRDFKHM